MRFSNLIAATFMGSASQAWADSTIVPASAFSTICTNSSTTYDVVPPYPSWTTTTTANFTDTVIITATISSYSDTFPSNATATTTSSASSTSSPLVVGTNAASPGEGLAGDRSVMGLVVFFALSLCLL